MASTLQKVQAKEDKPISRVDDVLNRAQELALRVEKIVDRLVGSAPKPTSDEAGESPEGDLYRLVQKASNTSAYIDDANEALDRLERTI